MIHLPKVPTDHLRLESLKTLSRLQLIWEFRPWLESSREFSQRRVPTPYTTLWDCLCYGAPLNTLLELIGSPTPRHLAVTADDFDFDLTLSERERFFTSFIHRVQVLESQARLSFGEVLRLEDFTRATNASFWRILQTVNRVIASLEESYPGIFIIPHGSDARRASLVNQLIESERLLVANAALAADFAAKLYEDPTAAHPSLEGFIVSCSRLIPYHDHVLKSLLDSVTLTAGSERWDLMFAFDNKVFYTRMNMSYRSICANYLTFFCFSKEVELQDPQYAEELLRKLSSLLNRFSEYKKILHAILEVTSPINRQSYEGLCTMTFEFSESADALEEIGMELRTMICLRILGPRLGTSSPLDTGVLGTILLDDCLIVDSNTGNYYSVFLFQETLLCFVDYRRSDSIAFGSSRYPIRPWEIGPALSNSYPLQMTLSIPTTSLKTLHLIDTDHFEITWGNNEESSIAFYPTMARQFNQWTGVLEPFVSRVMSSTSVPHYYQGADGASIHSGHVSLVPTSADERDGFRHSLRRKSSVARPWSLVGRKGVRSESSSVVGMDIQRAKSGGVESKSVLSPGMLPTLFLADLPKSPLRQSFAVADGEDIPSVPLLTDSPTDYPPSESLFSSFSNDVSDLTGHIVREGYFPVAHGGYSDVWKATWVKSDESEVKVAVKVFRNTSNDPMTDKLVKRLENELHVWKQLSHPCILELYGTVSDFGPHASMICPWQGNGSVTKYLEGCGDIVSVEERIMMICQVSEGLTYLHSRSIVHGDISGSNVLVSESGQLQICDFGLSSRLIDQEPSSSIDDADSELNAALSSSFQSIFLSDFGGSVRWADAYLFRSFEDDKPLEITTATDLYSLGSLMLEILSGRVPYHYLRTDAQVILQLNRGIKPRRPAAVFVDDSQWELIQRCWKEPPEERPSAAEACQLAKGLLDAHIKTNNAGQITPGFRKSA